MRAAATPPAPQSVKVVMAPNRAHVIPLKPTPLPSSRTETPLRGVVRCKAGRNDNFLQVNERAETELTCKKTK